MKKRRYWIISIIFIILIVGIFGTYFVLNGIPSKKVAAVNQINNYLLIKKEYNSDDINSIVGMYNLKSSNCPYGASVIFSDETEATYYYSVCNNNQIIQDGYTGISPKHKD